MKTMIRNVSQGTITLPPPYIGILPAGVAVVVDDPPAMVIAALYIVPETESLLTVTEVSDANPTTLRVTRETAASTIATATFSALTTPLDLNGQRAVNAADPVDAQDLITLSYYNSHVPGGGVTEAELGEVAVLGGPYPAIPSNTPVAMVNGALVVADAADPVRNACVGVYTGSTTNRLRTSGPMAIGLGLPVDAPVYLAPGGGFTGIVPSGAGQSIQRLGYSRGTSLQVDLGESIQLS